MKDMYSIEELADRWNVNYLTVYRQVKSGAIKAFRAGNQYRVLAEEVRKIEQSEKGEAND